MLTSGCSKINNLADLKLAAVGLNAVPSTEHGYSLYGPITFDAGAYEANNDMSATCSAQWQQGIQNSPLPAGTLVTRGCMTPPPIVYSDSRWFVGFSQNYLGSLAFPRVSLFVNMTDILGRTFGSLGSGLGIIDPGLGLIPAPAVTIASTRNPRFAVFPNQNVVAVYTVENATAGVPAYVRTVYASIYDATTNTWGAAIQLSSTNVATDNGVDFQTSTSLLYNGNQTTFCRPSVATAGDNTALAAWCEDGTGGYAHIVYRRYSGGSWGALTSMVNDPAPNYYYTNPGFMGRYVSLQALDTLGATTTTIQSGDIFSGSLSVIDTTTSYVDIATVAAANIGQAGPGQFAIATDPNTGVVQMCSTMQNLANALLSKPVYRTSLARTVTTTLSQQNVSITLNPECNDATSVASVQANPTKWTLSYYYNKSLNNTYRDKRSGQGDHELSALQHIRTATTTLTSTVVPNPVTTYEDWSKSAMVAVAGDGYGNYAMVRSSVSPVIQDTDISPTGVGYARRLVGHRYRNGSGWVQRSNPPSGSTSGQPDLSFVSRSPVCTLPGTNPTLTSTNYGCSVRNPTFLMAPNGQGIVLFHQRQNEAPFASATTLNPNRLWGATYSAATGFSSLAAPIDPDTICTAGSVANDTSVCETGSFDIATNSLYNDVSTNYDITTSATNLTMHCQVDSEPGYSTVQTSPHTKINHDIPPIAAAMNDSGKAVIAFHKRISNGSVGSPSCGHFATQVLTYSGSGGFSGAYQVDAGLGDTMHAQVAITPSGNYAVVWEEVRSDGAKYVFLRVFSNGTWNPIVEASAGQNNSNDSMMPSVGMNDLGEIVVTFTYGVSGATRRQYVRHYYYH